MRTLPPLPQPKGATRLKVALVMRRRATNALCKVNARSCSNTVKGAAMTRRNRPLAWAVGAVAIAKFDVANFNIPAYRRVNLHVYTRYERIYIGTRCVFTAACSEGYGSV